MRLSPWVSLAAWVIFGGIVFLPIAQLVIEVFRADSTTSLGLADWFLSERQWRLLGNSLLLAAGASAAAAAIGVPFAFLCEKTDLPAAPFFAIAYLVPLLIPPYVQAIVWNRLLADNSVINSWLIESLSLNQVPLDVNTLPGAIWVLAIAYFPFVMLLTISGMRSLDPAVEQAALQQQGALKTIVKVTLPLLRPHIAAGILFVFVFSIIDFGVPDILRIKVYPVEIFIEFSALYNEKAAIALAAPLLFITIVAIALLTRGMKGRAYVSFSGGVAGGVRFALSAARPAAFVFCSTVLVVAVVVPVVQLASTAGHLDTYAKVLTSSYEHIAGSFVLAAVAAICMTALSVAIVWSLHSATGFWRTLGEYLTQMPFAVAPVLLGIGMLKVWNHAAFDWLSASFLILIVGYVAHFIPFALRVVHSNVKQLDFGMVEAAALARGQGMAVFWYVILPLLRSGLLTAFFITFVLSLGELGTTLLIIPPGLTTLPIEIYNFMHYGAETTVAALCLIMLLLQLLLAGALYALDHFWLRARA